MTRLYATPIATQLSPDTFGASGARTVRAGGAPRWSRFAGRALPVKAILRDHAERSAPEAAQVVAQPWHGCENSAPDGHASRNPYHRIVEARLVSLKPDRRLTGERTAEGWATGLNDLSRSGSGVGGREVFSASACSASPENPSFAKREAEERNLLP